MENWYRESNFQRDKLRSFVDSDRQQQHQQTAIVYWSKIFNVSLGEVEMRGSDENEDTHMQLTIVVGSVVLACR